MNTLSFQMPQNMSLKTNASNAGKSDADASNGASTEGAESFREILSSQVKRDDAPPDRKNVRAEMSKPTKSEKIPHKKSSEDSLTGAGKTDNQAKTVTAEFAAAMSDQPVLAAIQEGEAKVKLAETEEKTGLVTPAHEIITHGMDIIMPAIPAESRMSVEIHASNRQFPADASLTATEKVQVSTSVQAGEAGLSLPQQLPEASDNAKFVDHLLELAGRQKAGIEPVKPGVAALSEQVSPQTVVPAGYQMAMQISQMPPELQAASSNIIPVYPGRPGWDQAIGSKVIWMVGAAEQSATLTLNPPELGPLKVVIHVHNNQADTTFISEHPEVRKAIENGIPALREMMGQSGINLGQANINSGSQQQDARSFENGGNSRSAAKEPLPSAVSEQPARTLSARINDGLVDTFA